MFDGILTLTFIGLLLAASALGGLFALRPWHPLRLMVRIVYGPFQRAGFDFPQLHHPVIRLLLTRRSLSEASAEEYESWESEMRFVRLVGLVMVAVAATLFGAIAIAVAVSAG